MSLCWFCGRVYLTLPRSPTCPMDVFVGVQQGSDVTRGSKGHRKCPNFSHSLNTRAPTSIRIFWSRSRAVITMAFYIVFLGRSFSTPKPPSQQFCSSFDCSIHQLCPATGPAKSSPRRSMVEAWDKGIAPTTKVISMLFHLMAQVEWHRQPTQDLSVAPIFKNKTRTPKT